MIKKICAGIVGVSLGVVLIFTGAVLYLADKRPDTLTARGQISLLHQQWVSLTICSVLVGALFALVIVAHKAAPARKIS